MASNCTNYSAFQHKLIQRSKWALKVFSPFICFRTVHGLLQLLLTCCGLHIALMHCLYRKLFYYTVHSMQRAAFVLSKNSKY
uniref:Uncharacterized protein n=1 Tax=Pyxicephalus adspersus TaxID=30357 RepID=A0AAV2ZNB1_PYXAD|nr:TPA: hypothetical protein GDO54_003330 [Pyxicephalus adspersus]